MKQHIQLELLIPSQDSKSIRTIADAMEKRLGDEGSVSVVQHELHGESQPADTQTRGALLEAIRVQVDVMQVLLSVVELVTLARRYGPKAAKLFVRIVNNGHSDVRSSIVILPDDSEREIQKKVRLAMESTPHGDS
jgi:hypothetical protein